MTFVVCKCPKCGGGVKIKESWPEAFCIYCNYKVKNDYQGLDWDEGQLFCDKVITGYIRSIEKYLKAGQSDVAVRFRVVTEAIRNSGGAFKERLFRSKKSYRALVDRLCLMAGTLNFERNRANWERLRNLVASMEFGGIVCLMYDDFYGIYNKALDKMIEVLDLPWASKKDRIVPEKEFTEIKMKVYSIKRFLNSSENVLHQ